MKTTPDAYGQQFLSQYHSHSEAIEIIERDDGYIDNGSDPGQYFQEYKHWPVEERRAIRYARGRVLDIGCGAGRHSLYLQQKGLKVIAIDNSPGAIQVCRLRGVRKAMLRSISDVNQFRPDSFDTILMLGNNFGLLGNIKRAKTILKQLNRITSADARIIAGTRNPYQTSNPDHLSYHRWNRERGRMPGQIRMRIRFQKNISPWFDYLFVSPKEMELLLQDSDWQVESFIGPGQENYFAIIRKKH